MANWCENNLVITGEESEINRFKEQAKAEHTDLSLDKLYPMPEELRELHIGGQTINGRYESTWREINGELAAVSKAELAALLIQFGATNWYNWRNKYWGTKWDVEAVLEYENKTTLEYRFDSAWTPPVAWLEKVAAEYPKLSFRLRFEEPGEGFMGIAKGDNGIVTGDWINL